jgi:hypothetical protein
MSNKPLTKTEWLASLEELWEAAQQPRPWVGLTGQEKDMIARVSVDVFEAMYRVETKLKERNT